jgi:hypothetical protein
VAGKVKQIYRQPFPDADEKDVVDRIDLSNLKLDSSDESLNYVETPPLQQLPLEYFYNKDLDTLLPRFIVERAEVKPNYKNLAGQRVLPTRINSLLTQNPGPITKNNSYEGYDFTGSRRPASQFYWWRQPDEGYYLKQYKKNTAFALANSTPGYYVVDGNSPHRLKFKCPHQKKGVPPEGWFIVNPEQDIAVQNLPDISIYIDPDNNRARWACPRCTIESSQKHLSFEDQKVLGKRYHHGKTFAIFHDIPRPLRIELAEDDIIPGKEYDYKDRKSEAPGLLAYITQNSGLGYNELDKAKGWPHGTAERIINTQLKDKVDIRKKRKGYKGYGIYIKH